MKKNVCLLLVMAMAWVLPVLAEPAPENGVVKQFDGDGQLQSVITYKQGHLLRKKVYHKSGQLILDVVYRDDAAIVIKTYYLNGRLKSVWSKKSQEARFFYPTGKQKVTVPVRDSSRLEQ